MYPHERFHMVRIRCAELVRRILVALMSQQSHVVLPAPQGEIPLSSSLHGAWRTWRGVDRGSDVMEPKHCRSVARRASRELGTVSLLRRLTEWSFAKFTVRAPSHSGFSPRLLARCDFWSDSRCLGRNSTITCDGTLHW